MNRAVRPHRDAPEQGRGAVDLHLHTTASDGRATPFQLVDHASSADLSVIAVTDHDTVAAVREAQTHAAVHGIEVVPGVEITAVEDGRDVHVLGYFIDVENVPFAEFLERQRSTRIARAEAIALRLADLGLPIDVRSLLSQAQQQRDRSVGRPLIAQAMVAAGYVADTREAFERWLGQDRPAFVPRSGTPTETVIEVIHQAGGLASLAHPGRTRIDDRIEQLCAAGLDAIEAHHSDHDSEVVDRYTRLASDLGILITGGSDFHGDPAHGLMPGGATLPSDAWRRLSAARLRHACR